jgi:chloramphenicol-sensitive protein RarD
MNVLGFCQYISPILTLLLGILFFNERFGWGELFPLLFIWSGIAVFLLAEVREHRKAH